VVLFFYGLGTVKRRNQENVRDAEVRKLIKWRDKMLYELLLATLFLVWMIDCVVCFFVGVYYADRSEVPTKAFLPIFSSIFLTVIVNFVMI